MAAEVPERPDLAKRIEEIPWRRYIDGAVDAIEVRSLICEVPRRTTFEVVLADPIEHAPGGWGDVEEVDYEEHFSDGAMIQLWEASPDGLEFLSRLRVTTPREIQSLGLSVWVPVSHGKGNIIVLEISTITKTYSSVSTHWIAQ